MISLNEYIKESLLDDEDVLMKDTGDETIKNEILKFLKDNYTNGDKCKISKNPINGKYIVDCDRSLTVKNINITSLTNEYFVFGIIGGYFDCSNCESLKSLGGAPKKIGNRFDCCYCKSLTSLKGAPKEVRGSFRCNNCKNQFTIDDIEKVSKVNGEIIC